MAELLEPDVVVLDIGLPHLSGHEVAISPAIPSAGAQDAFDCIDRLGSEDDKRRSLKSGFNEP